MAKPPSPSTRPAVVTGTLQKGAQPVAVHTPVKPQGGHIPTTGQGGSRPGTPPNQGSGGKK
jgi:hypothetical protein